LPFSQLEQAEQPELIASQLLFIGLYYPLSQVVHPQPIHANISSLTDNFILILIVILVIMGHVSLVIKTGFGPPSLLFELLCD
jgi:nitrate reductase gamma subunit